jgi:ribose/xylose/arabinose/galactoside ABC-type transport system permease subunit
MTTAPAKTLNNPPRVAELLTRYGIFLVLAIMVVSLSIITPIVRGEQYFLNPTNAIQVFLQAAINLVVALGMTFVIASAGIDLSVGSVIALGGLVAAYAMQAGSGPWLGFLVAMIVGTLCGAFNGLLVTRLGLQPFIVTLGTMGVFRGLALVISDGKPIYNFGPEFNAIFSGFVFGIPTAVLISLVLSVFCWWLLTQTRFGKYTMAIGSREQIVHLAGINVHAYKLRVYALCGLLTGVGAALLTARLSSADPIAGSLFELDAIAATVMGGTSLSGGVATIQGTVVGALIISLVRNGMNILNVPTFWQQLVIGGVIILAAVLDQWRKRQASARV